jgi:hypothetical protein
MKYKIQEEKWVRPKIKYRKVKGAVSSTGRNVYPEVVSEKTGTYRAAKSKIINSQA